MGRFKRWRGMRRWVTVPLCSTNSFSEYPRSRLRVRLAKMMARGLPSFTSFTRPCSKKFFLCHWISSIRRGKSGSSFNQKSTVDLDSPTLRQASEAEKLQTTIACMKSDCLTLTDSLVKACSIASNPEGFSDHHSISSHRRWSSGVSRLYT